MAIEDLKWADTDINFPSTGQPNKSGTIPSDLQIEGFEPFQSYDAEVFNEWMNRAYKSVEDLQTQITAINAQVATGIEPAFPIGSLYVNFSDNTNPATLLGFGTWSAVEGLTLVGAGSHTDSRGENKVFTAGNEEGVYRHVLTTNEMPSHNHSISTTESPLSSADGTDPARGSITGNPNTRGGTGSNKSIGQTGGSQPHQNMQPSLIVYMWKRTA